MLARVLLWLVTLCAFAMPPAIMPAAAATSGTHASMNHCPDHAPPPPCPGTDAVKHAAGLCCPLMAGAIAVLPAAVDGPTPASRLGHSLPVVSHLTGLCPVKDPPPPRV
jgi:hypothetical protein